MKFTRSLFTQALNAPYDEHVCGEARLAWTLFHWNALIHEIDVIVESELRVQVRIKVADESARWRPAAGQVHRIELEVRPRLDPNAVRTMARAEFPTINLIDLELELAPVAVIEFPKPPRTAWERILADEPLISVHGTGVSSVGHNS